MKIRLTLSFSIVLFWIGCARHFVVERDAGRIDGERSVMSMTDTGWAIAGEPPGEENAPAE